MAPEGQSVFSYVNASKRLRDGRASVHDKIALCKRLLDVHSCLTPRPFLLVAKHVTVLIDHYSLKDGNVSDCEPVADVLLELWSVLETAIKSDLNSLTYSENLTTQILRTAIPHLEKVSTCRSALICLLNFPPVRSTKQLPVLVELLSSLVPITNLNIVQNERTSQHSLVATVIRVVDDILPRLRDHHQAQVLTLRLVPILLKSNFSSHLNSFHRFIFQESLRIPHPFLTVLDSDNVDAAIPYILSTYHNLHSTRSLTTATIANYFISDLASRVSSCAKNLELTTSSSLSHYVTAIISTFETVVSLDLKLFTMVEPKIAPLAKKPRLLAAVPPSKLGSSTVSHDAEPLFASLVNLSMKLQESSAELTQVLPRVLKASAIIIEASLDVVEDHLPSLLTICASLDISKKSETLMYSAVLSIFHSLLNSFFRSRRLPMFFQLLASSSVGRPMYTHFKVILQSASFVNRLAWCICELPIGGAIRCVNFLVRKSSVPSGADLENLIYLVSTVIECCKMKDRGGVAEFVNAELLTWISNISLSGKRGPLMFLLGSVLLSVLQCHSCIGEEKALMDLSVALVRSISEELIAIFSNKSPEPGQSVGKARRVLTDISSSDKVSFVLGSIKKLCSKESSVEAVCQIRLLSIAIRVSLKDFASDEIGHAENVEGIKDMLRLMFSQFKTLFKSESKDDTQGYCAPVEPKLDSAVFTLISMSDVIDTFWNGDNSKTLSWMLEYCLSKWSTRDDLWSELLEHQYVRQGFKKAICRHIKNVLCGLKSGNISACENNVCEVCKIVSLLLKIPKRCVNNGDKTDVARKVISLKNQSCCQDAKDLATIWLVGMSENETSLEPDFACLNDWDVGWDKLENVERRVGLLKKVSKWNSKFRDPKLLILNELLKHEDKWTNTCMEALDKVEYVQRWRALRTVLDVSRIIYASKDEEIRKSFNSKIFSMICYVFKCEEWFEMINEENGNDKKSETGDEVRFVLTRAFNAKCVILMLDDAIDCTKVSSEKAEKTLELAGFYLLISNWTGNATGTSLKLNIVRKMFQLCVELASICTDQTAVLKRATLCSLCCEVLMHRSMSKLQAMSNWETLAVNLSTLMRQIYNNFSAVDKYIYNRSQCDEIVFLLKTLASCVIVMLRTQRVIHWGRWATVSLVCSIIYCAHQASHVCENASQCGLVVANLLSTVEWCRGQGHLTSEATKTILISCAEALSSSTSTRFETPVMTAMASLVQSLPHDTLSILGASASPSLTDILSNLNHLSHQSDYDGQ